MEFLAYLFYPNPGRLTYSSPVIIAALVACAALVVLSFAIKYWRGQVQNAVTKKLSRAWSSISFWFGLTGLVLVVARVEKIQFVAMRFLWVLWALVLILLIALQWRIFRSRHYEVLPRVGKVDPRDQYLPGKKK
ncbi:MAG: hypothetical protein HOO67_01400 [Candidatus Peribacteraceae bacterium]|nr:hypothetical protein [Candidatus Peribacteraceae bacterium]